MSHRAAVYTVRVARRADRKVARPLGDVDGAGTSLHDLLRAYFADFTEASADGGTLVRSTGSSTSGDHLFAALQQGQKGLAAEIVDPQGGLRLRQTPDDVQFVRCGCLFRLPRTGRRGWLALHVNNGRGAKELLEQGLIERFRGGFPDLTLEITRYVEGAALQDAVEQDRIERVKLVRLERPDQRATTATGKWVAPGDVGLVELAVTNRTAGSRIRPELVRRFLGGDQGALAEMLEFDGLEFDAAKVEVVLPDSTRRTFNVAHPDGGRPVTRELSHLEFDADGEPTDDSLFEELRRSLAGVR